LGPFIPFYMCIPYSHNFEGYPRIMKGLLEFCIQTLSGQQVRNYGSVLTGEITYLGLFIYEGQGNTFVFHHFFNILRGKRPNSNSSFYLFE
jgi:hypothetical protein